MCSCMHAYVRVWQCLVHANVFPSNNGPSWQPAGSLTSDRKQCIFIFPLYKPRRTHTHTQGGTQSGSLWLSCHQAVWTISQGRSLHLYAPLFLALALLFKSFLPSILLFLLRLVLIFFPHTLWLFTSASLLLFELVLCYLLSRLSSRHTAVQTSVFNIILSRSILRPHVFWQLFNLARPSL